MDLDAAREILRQNIIMPTTSNDEGWKNLPDGDLLFYPYSAFIRELYNNASQLRQLMKPRRVDESLPKPTAPARKQMKKKPAKAKKQSKTNQRKKSLSKAEEESLKFTLKKLKKKPEKSSRR